MEKATLLYCCCNAQSAQSLTVSLWTKCSFSSALLINAVYLASYAGLWETVSLVSLWSSWGLLCLTKQSEGWRFTQSRDFISLSPLPCFCHKIFNLQSMKSRQRNTRSPLFCLGFSVYSKCCIDSLAPLPIVMPLLFSCKWSWMLFFRNAFLVEMLILPLHSVTDPFPISLLLSSLFPLCATDYIIDANAVTCVRSGGSSGLLLCNTLSRNIN